MQPPLMTLTLAAVASVLLFELLVCADAQYYSSENYSYWSDPTVDLPKLFSVDPKLEKVVVAATNTIFHLSLDLKDTSNTLDVTPSYETFYHCKFEIFNPDEACQNFHHILYFQSGPGNISTTFGQVPKEETVLVCGSNAYNPECMYRNRTNLEYLTQFQASGFCPLGGEYGVTLVTDSELIVAGLALDSQSSYYAITLSSSSGEILLQTIKDDFLYFSNPTFVSLHEHGDFYYLFMTEYPVESNQYETFSRVARVCKNDAGRSNLAQHVFVTYVKARMVCQSTRFSRKAFNYNLLQDMVLVTSSSVNAPISGEHLYGIFAAEINGPTGSALCFYTFDSLDETLSGNFLIQSSASEWTEVENDPPLTCAEGRSVDSAMEKVLMKEVARQEEGEPIITMDAAVFHKLLVDKVTALDQLEYEVLLIAASVHHKLELLKLTYIPTRKGSDKSFVIQAIPLKRNGSGGISQDVGKMELHRTDDEAFVYLSTAEGLYVVPIANCSAHPDCQSCVEARDPYCAYDITNSSCVSLLRNTGDSPKLQDVVNGNSTGCEGLPSGQSRLPPITPSPSPFSVIFSSDTGASNRAGLDEMSSPSTVGPEPSTGNNESQDHPLFDHLWTTVAAVGGLLVGSVTGLLLFATIRNREKFIRCHNLLHKR